MIGPLLERGVGEGEGEALMVEAVDEGVGLGVAAAETGTVEVCETGIEEGVGEGVGGVFVSLNQTGCGCGGELLG